MSQRELPLKFDQIRTFGKVFSDTRKLIRENFAVFLKTILFLVGPIILLTCTVDTFYDTNIIGDDEFDWEKVGSYVASKTIYAQLRWLINGLFTAMVVSHFVKVYKEKGPGKFDVNDVTKSLFSDFGGSMLTLILVFAMTSLVGVLVAAILFGVAELSIGVGVFLIIVTYIGYFLVRFPFWYFMYSIFFARHSEAKLRNAIAGLQFSAQVLKGRWWFTWIVFFCMWALLAVLGSVISLPAEILAMIAQLSTFDPTTNTEIDWKLVQCILTSLGEFAKTLINSVFCAAIALHFYSLKEKKDGKGTMEMLDQIGKNKDDDHIELTY